MFLFRKAKKIYQKTFSLYQNKKEDLPEESRNMFRSCFQGLKSAIETRDRKTVKMHVKELQSLQKKELPIPFSEKFFYHTGQLLIALFFVIIVRQMWFELYMIPSGSMRPTFKEGDWVCVNKTAFSVNRPLQTGHFYFQEEHMKRGNAVVFNAENIDLREPDMLYFFLVPGKKQLVKRLIGKPGDSIYFYGGKIYGIDKENKPLLMLQNDPCFASLEHIPFLQLGGKVKNKEKPENGIYPSSVVYQMNQPVIKLSSRSFPHVTGEMLRQQDNPLASHYYDFLGIANYANARILTKSQYEFFTRKKLEEPYEYCLELTHHPSLEKAEFTHDLQEMMRPDFYYHKSYLPLDEPYLKKIFSKMNTVRFVVKQERAYAYGRSFLSISSPRIKDIPGMKDVPEGVYEFDKGRFYTIDFFRNATEPKEHPLLEYSPELTTFLYNLGVEFDTHFLPASQQQRLHPSRFAYFRKGDLYLMGAPIFRKEDPTLKNFVQKEMLQENPFIDQGPPLLKDGSFDVKKIRRLGIQVPEKSYLVLGDNHAISGDSREFGFVPEENFKGVVTHVVFPFGGRLGAILQPYSSWCTLPKTAAYVLFLLVVSSFFFYQTYEIQQAWKKEIS